MTIDAKPVPLKYAYAMHRPIMAWDKKRLGVGDEVSLQPGDIGLVVVADRELTRTQLVDIVADRYGGSNKIKGIVLTFAIAQPKLYQSTFLTESGATYLYGFTSSCGEITVLTADTGNFSAWGSGVSGQAIFNNQDGSGTRGYQVSFSLPWKTLE